MDSYQSRLIIAVVTVVMLFFAVGDWDYWYYELLRWLVFAGGLYIAVGFKQIEATDWYYLLIIISVIFNPIAPFHFDRSSWYVIDIIVAFLYIFIAGNIYDERA